MWKNIVDEFFRLVRPGDIWDPKGPRSVGRQIVSWTVFVVFLLGPWILLAWHPIAGVIGAVTAILFTSTAYHMGDSFGNHQLQTILILSALGCCSMILVEHFNQLTTEAEARKEAQLSMDSTRVHTNVDVANATNVRINSRQGDFLLRTSSLEADTV
jgi:hypothetical protein|tara:strand:- start:2200 stop:2670 length:471 start_codon:yes stop_codon:yes gene_type:complete